MEWSEPMSKTQILIKQILLGILVVVSMGIYFESRETNHQNNELLNMRNDLEIIQHEDLVNAMRGISEILRQSEEHLTAIDEALADSGE